MGHEQRLEQLSRYVDGDLSPSEKEEMASHLSSCDACARTWRLWTDARDRLSPLQQATLGPGFRAQVMTAIDRAEGAAEPRLTWAPWLGLAATAALTVALFLPTPGNEMASTDPTGLYTLASAQTLPNNPMPDWMMEAE